MSEPIVVKSKAGKEQTLSSPSEAARLVSSGEWTLVSGSAVTLPIPTEEAVHVEADTTDPVPFSDGLPEKANYINQKRK